jgi:nucleoid-associated protein YgaU
MSVATLQCMFPIPGLVKFDLNPDQITMTRTSSLGSRGNASPRAGVPGGASGSIFKKSVAPMITLNKVVFFGNDTKGRVDQLMDWMSPGGGMLGALAGAALSAATGGAINLVSRPPMVIFSWGPPKAAFFYEGIITTVTAKYERFSRSGIPTRAELTIKLQEQPSLLGMLATNPTSGGLPGRKAHTVSSGDSLARIATDQYGSPGRWRQIAETNGIDDPLRVRPGDRVYLPNPEELR